MLFDLRKIKYYIICVLIMLSCMAIVLCIYSQEQSNSEIIAGATVINVTCNHDTKEVISYVANDEKFFRPSKLPVLNTRKDTESLINYYYDKKPEKIEIPKVYFKTPDDTILNYFSLLKEAANPIDGKGAGCGTLGTAKAPYKIGYNFLSGDYKSKVSFIEYENSFKNILHINLIKYKELPTDSLHKDSIKYFYEIETIQGSENNVANFAYYYGYMYLMKIGDEYKISDINIAPENYLCAPYHGWSYDGEMSVEIRYGNWCKLMKAIEHTEINGYIKNIYFKGTDGKDYKIQFFTLTNDTDFEVAQYVLNENGQWQYIELNPYECVEKQ